MNRAARLTAAILPLHCIGQLRRSSTTLSDDVTLELLYGCDPTLTTRVSLSPTAATTSHQKRHRKGHEIQRNVIGASIQDAVYSGGLSVDYAQELCRKKAVQHMDQLAASSSRLGADLPAAENVAFDTLAVLTVLEDSVMHQKEIDVALRLTAAVDLVFICACCPAHEEHLGTSFTLAMRQLHQSHSAQALPMNVLERLAAILMTAATVNEALLRDSSARLIKAFRRMQLSGPELASAHQWLTAVAEQRHSQAAHMGSATQVLLYAPSSHDAAALASQGTQECRRLIQHHCDQLPTSSTSISRTYVAACRHAMLATFYARRIARAPQYLVHVEEMMHVWPMLLAHSLPTGSLRTMCFDVARRSNAISPVRAYQVLLEHLNSLPAQQRSAASATHDLSDVLELASPHELRVSRAVLRPHQPLGDHQSLVPLRASWGAEWTVALSQLVATMHAPETKSSSSWRDGVPAAMAALNDARRFEGTVQLFDEYAALTNGADLWMTTSGQPQAKLDIVAVESFARAVAKTLRWFRALDIVTALGYCDPREASLTTAVRTWQYAAESVRSQWRPALALASLMEQHGAPAATRDACAPFVLEAVSKMNKDASGHWLAALNVVKGSLEADASTVQHAEALVRIAAWLRPHDAYEVVAASMTSSLASPTPGQTSWLTSRIASTVPRTYSLVQIASKQYARHGHWTDALRLATLVASHEGLNKGVWEAVAAALQHQHLSSPRPNEKEQFTHSAAPLVSSLAVCAPTCIAHNPSRLVLRGLLRASENNGCVPDCAHAMSSLLSSTGSHNAASYQREYAAWAEMLRKAHRGDWRGVARALPIVLSDTYLVHAASTASWMARAAALQVAPHSAGRQRRSLAAVKFLWTSETLKSLNVTCKGDMTTFAERVLQVAPHQLLARDAKKRPEVGGHMYIMPLRRTEHDDGPSADLQHSRMLVAASNNHCVVAAKPPGWTVEAFSDAVQQQHPVQALVPLYRLQALTQGLVVFVPLGSATVEYQVTMLVLLGLRRIGVDAAPLLRVEAYSKYRLRLVHAVEAGSLLPSTEIIVVEARCHSNAAHGPAGTLYDLTVDLALDGWGYVGDPANVHVEQQMDESATGGRRASASRSMESGLEGRALFFLREVIVHAPHPSLVAAVGADDTGDVTDAAVGSSRMLQADLPVPRWWTDLGLFADDDPDGVVTDDVDIQEALAADL